jgi:hypothetical protein
MERLRKSNLNGKHPFGTLKVEEQLLLKEMDHRWQEREKKTRVRMHGAPRPYNYRK